MKLTGEVQYTGKKYSFLRGIYYANVSFSLGDVEEEDFLKIQEEVSEKTCPSFLGIPIGFYKNSTKKPNTIKYFSPLFRNRTRLEYFPNQKRLNIFAKGPNAEEIEIAITKLIPSKRTGLEELAINKIEVL